MRNSGTTYIARKDDYRRIEDSDDEKSSAVFYSNRALIERILDREVVNKDNSELLSYAIFQSILKNILKDLLNHGKELAPAVLENLLRCVNELDKQTDPASGLVGIDFTYSLEIVLNHRFRNKKNLLETLLESGYFDLDEVSRKNVEHLKKLMIQAKIKVPEKVEEIYARLIGLSKQFVAYEGTVHTTFRKDMIDFIKKISMQKNMNVRVMSGDTLFHTLIPHLIDPRNINKAHICLEILSQELSLLECGGWGIDPDLLDGNAQTSEKIVKDTFSLFMAHPDNFSKIALFQNQKFAHDWINYLRDARRDFLALQQQ